MKASLRQILADSHISAVAVAVLLLWSLEWGCLALLGALFRALHFLFTAVAILGIPYSSTTLTVEDRFLLITTFSDLFYTCISLGAAWLLSRWVYGVGPLRSLSKYHTRVTRRQHV